VHSQYQTFNPFVLPVEIKIMLTARASTSGKAFVHTSNKWRKSLLWVGHLARVLQVRAAASVGFRACRVRTLPFHFAVRRRVLVEGIFRYFQTSVNVGAKALASAALKALKRENDRSCNVFIHKQALSRSMFQRHCVYSFFELRFKVTNN